MLSIDLSYLQRIQAASNPSALLLEPAFLDAQELFFEVVREMGGSVDFDIADMREVHAIAALGSSEKGIKVLDVGCGSPEEYVLEDTFRDKYPPFFAAMLQKRGAQVTGVDIRPFPAATYDHRVLDITKPTWVEALQPQYDMVACLNIFNAPKSPFEHDVKLCERLTQDMMSLVQVGGILLLTLRDDVLDQKKDTSERKKLVESMYRSIGFQLLFLDQNCAWLQKMA